MKSSIERPARPIEIMARDGILLRARIFLGSTTSLICILHGATAVPQEFYASFAEFLSSQGLTVITYDYRGMGASRDHEKNLKSCTADLLSWARLDAEAVHLWVEQNYPEAKQLVVGHSFGGHLLGLINKNTRLHRILLISCPLGYWRDLPRSTRVFAFFHWYVFFPICIRIFGYVPLKRFGLGEDLPGGVAEQWRRWSTNPNYFLSDENSFGKSDNLAESKFDIRSQFQKLKVPIRSYGFTDDPFASRRSLEKMIQLLPEEQVEFLFLSPENFKVDSIGHNGFFKPKMQGLWSELLAWLTEP